jgi:hypothetical protein
VLPVSVHVRKRRTTDMLRPLTPSRRHLDRIDALPHQLSQRVTPTRDRMTLRHRAYDEARTVPTSPELFKKTLTLVGVGPGDAQRVTRGLRHPEVDLE